MIRAIVIAGVLAMQARAQAPAPTPAGGSISGRVSNSVTGAGIEGATVRACVVLVACLGPNVNLEGVTDVAGAFRIEGVPDGQYMIDLAPLPGFMPAFVAQLGPAPSVRVSGDTRLDLQMTPSASIRGRVLDPEGKPAAGVIVKLDAGGCSDCAPLDLKEVDEDGEFLFENVLPGFAVILSATPKPQPNATDETRIVTTYYPSVVDIKQATPIRHQGLDLIGYDLRMQTALGRAIRGVVIGVDGKPARAAMVSVVKPASGMVSMIRGAWGGFPAPVAGAEPGQTRSDGKFVFPPVLEGDWTLRAVQRQDDYLSGGATAIDVSVSKNDIDNLEIHLAPAFTVEVTADWGDSPPVKAPPAFTMIRAVDGLLAVFPGEVELGKPQRLDLYSGRYFISPGIVPTPGYYVAGAILENRDVLGQVVELTGPTSLKVVFKTGGGSVRGTVEKGASSLVILMADATSASQLGYSGTCDPNGAFFVPDLPPGEYTVVALPGPPGDPLLPEFQSLLIANGKRVKVEAGSTAQVDLRLARQP
jgi:hypothetical protein